MAIESETPSPWLDSLAMQTGKSTVYAANRVPQHPPPWRANDLSGGGDAAGLCACTSRWGFRGDAAA